MIDVEMLRPTADEMLSGLCADDALKQRVLFAADPGKHLPQATAEMLGGLHASPALRHRILVAAQRKKPAERPVSAEGKKTRHTPLVRRLPVLGMALVMALMVGLGVNYGAQQPSLLPPAAVTDGADLGSYTMGAGDSGDAVPQYRSLFADQGPNPSLVGINGRFYQMLNVAVPQDVIGSVIAEVQDFTNEPSLAATVGVISNIAPTGTQVYSVDGISSKTACIVEVGSIPRLFQRVGYASGTTIGREMLEDTLDVYGRVSMLELSGVGYIYDADTANQLIYMLSEFASYHGSDVVSSGQALTIYLDNGLSFQLTVSGDILSGCGAWSCPEFFEAFVTEM